MQSIYNHGPDEESETTLIEDLEGKLCLTQESCTQNPISEEDEQEENEQEEEEEFSFMCGGGNSSPIAAEDAFINGQIKPVFPLFNRDLLLGEIPQVKKMFVEGISGPCCEWSKESSSSSSAAEVAVAVAPELSKKSNSTGFSKLWRFRDLLSRSNSDGRDAFVFLNNQETTSSSSSSSSEVRKEDEKKLKNQETTSSSSSSSFEVRKEDEKKLKNQETTSSDEKKVKGKKKSVKSKTTTLSPHEIYLKSKAKGDDRRRSYLPYRPEVFGFFTNVNGGMSRNVHPF